jgi:hypothetical protein
VPNSVVEQLVALLKKDWTVTEDAAIKVEQLSDNSEHGESSASDEKDPSSEED